jgi:hypothetical protein
VGGISSSQDVLDALAGELQRLAGEHPEVQPAGCVLVRSANTPEAVEIANEVAPEHLQLIGAEPQELASRVRAAGCVFVGPGAATAFGDYGGSSHILPTAGAAGSPRCSLHGTSAGGWRGADRGGGGRRASGAAGPDHGRGAQAACPAMEARAGQAAGSAPVPGTPSEPPLGDN